jgi:hypothetical protein
MQTGTPARGRLTLAWLAERIGVGVGIGIGVERTSRAFGHERLDVYRLAIDDVAWVCRLCEELKVHRNAKDHRLRASQAILLNIAEGNGGGPGCQPEGV